MTDTARRALLGAIALAPAFGIASAAASPVAADLAALDTDALLRYGAALDADRGFANLCAATIEARASSDTAAQRADAADEAADAETPPFPAELCWRERWRDPDTGETETYERRWTREPRNSGMLWNLTHRLKDKAGISYPDAQARLLALHDDWHEARRAACERHYTDALNEASMSAGREACRAMDAAIAYPARSGAVLFVQLHLRRSECLLINGEDEWSAFVAHVERALH
jgi:hypothetical protein